MEEKTFELHFVFDMDIERFMNIMPLAQALTTTRPVMSQVFQTTALTVNPLALVLNYKQHCGRDQMARVVVITYVFASSQSQLGKRLMWVIPNLHVRPTDDRSWPSKTRHRPTSESD